MASEESSEWSGVWVWLAPCFTSSEDGEGMVCDGGLWVWLAPCFESGEGVVSGDVLMTTTKPGDGWSHSA